ncbi:MerR family transcriptional regulator [Azovibrio restrictus]|uniref:MerR family transcriptional regulator n=1 Tax=Azovibrio restrictus TaxID=146938 RepID=UPI0026EEFB84|nr:MerR family transcriptional regulator [Azovibrio restrictus]
MNEGKAPVLLRIGDLARQVGLTVRTLHHYDEIGLVRPSGRSPAGYRLYSDTDVQRLHAVLALRQLGFGLARIGGMLDAGQAPLDGLIEAQLEAVDQDLANARALRSQLVVLRNVLRRGGLPETRQLLATLNLMKTYQRYFSPEALEHLLQRWHDTRQLRNSLLEAVGQAMAAGRPSDDPAVQALAQRWMDWAMELTNGSLPAALRWSRMHAEVPEMAWHEGLDPALLAYIGAALDLRMAALRRHLTEAEILRLDTRLAPQWRDLAARAEALMRQPGAERSPEARALLQAWDALAAQMAGGDPELQARLRQAYRVEPLLQHGHAVTPELRAFVERIRRGLDPHVT